MRSLDAEKVYRLLSRIAAVRSIYLQWAEKLRHEFLHAGSVEAEQRLEAISQLHQVLTRRRLVETFEEMPAAAQAILLDAERVPATKRLARRKPLLFPRSRQMHIFALPFRYFCLESDDPEEIEENRREEEEWNEYMAERAKKPEKKTRLRKKK